MFYLYLFLKVYLLADRMSPGVRKETKGFLCRRIWLSDSPSVTLWWELACTSHNNRWLSQTDHQKLPSSNNFKKRSIYCNFFSFSYISLLHINTKFFFSFQKLSKLRNECRTHRPQVSIHPVDVISKLFFRWNSLVASFSALSLPPACRAR